MTTSALAISSTIKLRSGNYMPLLGLGVFQNKGDTVTSACLAAFKAGYRHVDSAILYRNEKEVGNAVSQCGIPRDELFITSKIQSRDHGYDKTLRKIDGLLAAFNLEYIDLFLIHDPLSGKEKRVETWKALIKAKEGRKVRDIGVSNYNVHHLKEIIDAELEVPSINQIELHPFCQQRPIVEFCQTHNIQIQAYCPLLRGSRWDDPVLRTVASEVGQRAGRDVGVGQVLVRWSLQKGYSPLPKSSSPERVVLNADIYDFELSQEEMNKIDGLDEGNRGALSWNPVDAS